MRNRLNFLIAGLLIWIIFIVSTPAQIKTTEILGVAIKPAHANVIFSAMEKSVQIPPRDHTADTNLLSDLERYVLLERLLDDNIRANNQKALPAIVYEMRVVLDRIEKELPRFPAKSESLNKVKPLELIPFDRRQLELLGNCKSQCLNRINLSIKRYSSFAELKTAIDENIWDEQQRLTDLVNKLEQGKSMAVEMNRSRNWFCRVWLPIMVFYAAIGVYPIAIAILLLALLFCR